MHIHYFIHSTHISHATFPAGPCLRDLRVGIEMRTSSAAIYIHIYTSILHTHHTRPPLQGPISEISASGDAPVFRYIYNIYNTYIYITCIHTYFTNI